MQNPPYAAFVPKSETDVFAFDGIAVVEHSTFNLE